MIFPKHAQIGAVHQNVSAQASVVSLIMDVHQATSGFSPTAIRVLTTCRDFLRIGCWCSEATKFR